MKKILLILSLLVVTSCSLDDFFNNGGGNGNGKDKLTSFIVAETPENECNPINTDFNLKLYHTNESKAPYAVVGDTIYTDKFRVNPFFSGSFLAHNQEARQGAGFAIVTNEEGLVLAFNCE